MVGVEEMDVVGKTGCAASIGPGGLGAKSLSLFNNSGFFGKESWLDHG